jgi:hypothetical protein
LTIEKKIVDWVNNNCFNMINREIDFEDFERQHLLDSVYLQEDERRIRREIMKEEDKITVRSPRKRKKNVRTELRFKKPRIITKVSRTRLPF